MATVAIDQSDAKAPLISEKPAKWIGVPLVTLFALGMTVLASYEMLHILKRVAILAAVTYAFLAVLYFWCSRSWKDGVTIREIFYTIFWFLGLRKLIRSVRTDGIRHASGLHIAAEDDDSWCVIPSASWAVGIGVFITIVTMAVLPILVIINLFHLAFAMLWFVVAVWALCDAVYYLSGAVWKDGVTGKETLLTIFGGPFAVGIRTYKAARLRRQVEANLQRQPELSAVEASVA